MKHKILSVLGAHQSHFISGEMIAKETKMTRANVWKYIAQLRADGYDIEAVRNRGYRLVSLKGTITKDLISKGLQKPVDVIVLDTVTSTNTYAKSLTQDSLVVANHQSQGKGRFGKSFDSQENQGIYMTYRFKPTNDRLLTLKAALAVIDGIEETTGILCDIKWLNDIQYQGLKVGGILTEGSLEIETMTYDFICIGIGLNIETQHFPKHLESIATSLHHINPNLDINKHQLIVSIINHFTRIVDLKDDLVLERYKLRCVTLGTYIRDTLKVIDMDREGNLICEDIHTLERSVIPYGIEH